MRLVKHLLPLSQLHPSSMAMIKVILVVCCCAASGRAQSDKQPQRGYSPGGAYALSEIETISATAGNMMLKIPLAALPPGRGGSPGFALNLFYNSKIYDPITQRMPNRAGQMTTQMFMDASPGANWQFGLRYDLEVLDKRNEYRYMDQSGPSCGTDFQNFPKLVKVRMRFPDGGMHEFRPLGEAANEKDGYYTVAPNGSRHRCSSCTSCPASAILETSPASYATRTYYSADGTYQRLVISYGPPDAYGYRAEYWTLSFPDGGYVTNDLGPASSPNLGNRIYDRNGNYTEIISSAGGGTQAALITDQLGRKITVVWDDNAKQHHIYSPGFGIGDEQLKTTVKWKDIRVNKTIRTGAIYNGGGDDYPYTRSFRVVEQILLPQQSGGLAYGFSYNADSSNPSNGWGEVSSVTLPTGARADYAYRMDGLDGLNANVVLKNHPVRKSLTYLEKYDGVTQEKTDRWNFQLGTGSIESYNNCTHSQMTGPDGGVVSESFYAVEDSSNPFKGLVYWTGYPDGSVVETLWRTNNVLEADTPGSSSANPYVKSEYSSIRDAGGNLTKTAIKDYNYDKNGNVTRVKEYDLTAYGSVHDGSGSPLWGVARPAIKRDIVNAYYRATPDAADWTSSDPDAYHQPTAARLRTALSSSEVSDGAQALSRTELFFDDSATTGNLIAQRSWDSYKGGTYKAITRPLGEGGADNYVSVSHEYDENTTAPSLRYGNRTLTEDTSGSKTKLTYGPVNGVVGLYPTEVRAAFGTAVEQVTAAEYDFETGLVTRATDPNGVATTTAYDAFGRPTWVKRAVNTPAESHTRVIYSDVERLVITRSNLSSLSDSKLVSVEHYDQLGRVRLTRKLENSTALITDAPAAAETDEFVGIKVQARYLSVNPCHTQNTADCVAANAQHMANYRLVSNPYRAATSAAASAEPTMGWARSKSDRGGRVIEAETFAGGGLPAPWAADPVAANTASTGKVLTSYDAEYTTVTDQQGKPRRSVTDALGRLLRVDEPTAAGLGAPAAPNQPTCYAYDALSNLTGVRQGGQWQAGQCQDSPQADRTFQYSSLSRLTSASNPEGGVVNYTYYDNGSLKTKTDARDVTTTHFYDELGRVTARTYTAYTTAEGETISTPSVSYFYDSQWPTAAGAPALDRGLSKGRLVAVTYGGGADGTYLGGYDAAGRVTKSVQRTDGQPYSFPSYAYDLAGNLTSQTYPSGRVVATEYDAAGRFAGVKDAGAGRYWAGGLPGTKAVSYAAHGALTGVRLGNGLWEGTGFNSRLQPTSISLDAKSRTTTDLKSLVLHYTYGLTVDGVLDAAKNNGNVESQTVIIPDPADPRADLLRVKQSYEYDEVNRLASARETTVSTGAQVWRQVYSYDRFGNRTLAGGTTAPALPPGVTDDYWNPSISQTNNHIDSPGYTYDEAGNLAQTPGAVAGTSNRAVYNGENRMVAYRHEQTTLGTYTYDGGGRRVKKEAGGAATVFVYDALGKLVAEYTSAPPVRNGTLYLTSDHLGSPRVVTDAAGTVKSRHDYRPFGDEIVDGAGGRNTIPTYAAADNVRQRFTSKERDVETGLDYFGARYYGSTTGRFTGVDPAKIKLKTQLNPQDLNRFAYVANNPLRYIDPDGREKLEIIIRTFIPQKTVSLVHPNGGVRTFEGDDRKVGEHSERYRTEHRITIETDPKKNNGNVLYGNPSGKSGQTIEHGWFGDYTGKSSGKSLEADAKRYGDTVSVQAKGDESNPLVMGSPGITYDFVLGIKSEGPKGNVTVSLAGQHDGFPGYEVMIVRPETGDNSERLIHGHDPRDTGQTALSLAGSGEFEVKKTCTIDGKGKRTCN